MNSKRLNQSTSVGSRPRKKKGGPVSLVIKLLIAFVVIGYLVSLLFNDIERDIATLCRMDGVLPRETAILLDSTDGFASTQADSINRQLEILLRESVLDEKYTFFALGPSTNTYYPRFSLCNPGDGMDDPALSIADRNTYQNWDEEIKQRVHSEVDDLIGQERRNSSPVMEMIRYASYQNRWSSADSEKRLIVISPMIHNTSEFSHLTDSTNFGELQGTDYLNQVIAFLENVDVTLWYVQKRQAVAIQNRGHIESFWRPYVDASGGSIVDVKSIN